MPSAITRRPRHRRNRKENLVANQPQPVSPILVTNATVSTSALTLTFDQPVSLTGVPQFTTNLPTPTPVSAEKTAPNVVVITFSASVAAATGVNIPFRDPAIRSPSGGYVTASAAPIAGA